jgi:hypothetical protein
VFPTASEIVEATPTACEIEEAIPTAYKILAGVFKAGFARLLMFSSLNIISLKVRTSSLTGFYNLKIVVASYPNNLIFLDLEANLLLA